MQHCRLLPAGAGARIDGASRSIARWRGFINMPTAAWHNHPEKIVPGLKRKVAAVGKGMQIALLTAIAALGALDAFLETEQISRIAGPHCYEMFLGKVEFKAEMENTIGTFFPTDYMVRHFERIVMRGMGIRQHPELRDMYFGQYRRVLCIAQTDCKKLQAKAVQAAAELGLIIPVCRLWRIH